MDSNRLSSPAGGCDDTPPLHAYKEGTVKVEMFRLGEGCSENCASCGAYSAERDPGDFCVKEVSRGRIHRCINAILKSTRNEVFPSYVTTDVQQEPLNGDAFFDFMRLIKKMTRGKTRAICISHGLHTTKDGKVVNPAAEERLRKIARFMDKRDAFVLSFDTMRSNARIGDDENVASYVETLDRLKFAVRRGVRVTISIQGVDGVDSDNPNYAYSRKRAQELLAVVINKLREEKKWTLEEVGGLVKDLSRQFVRIGRAAKEFPWLDPAGETPVIPDAEVIKKLYEGGDLSHTLRARMNCVTGELEAQANNPLRSYGDTIRGPWGKVSLEYPVKGRAVLRNVRRGVKRTVDAVLMARFMRRRDAATRGAQGEIRQGAVGGVDVVVVTGSMGGTAAGVSDVLVEDLEADFAGEDVCLEGRRDEHVAGAGVQEQAKEGEAGENDPNADSDADDTDEEEAKGRLNDPESETDI